MGPRTEYGMLPPESAQAIYLAMESLSTNVNAKVDGQNQKFDAQSRVLEKIVDGIDAIKDQLRDGRVTFAEHEGAIDVLDTRLKDVESDVHKLLPVNQRKAPTGLHPTISKTPLGTRALTDRMGKSEERWLISPKLVNAFLLALIAAVGTSVGGLIVARMNASQFGDMVKEAVAERKATETATPTPDPAQAAPATAPP